MSQVRFNKVLALPQVLTPDSVYFVKNGQYTETYLTDANAVAYMVGNTAMTNALIDAKLSTATILNKVADIPARNAAATASTGNGLYLVVNATGDSTVTTGAALYFYDKAGNAYTKLSEYESLDVVTTWSMVSGRPASTPSAIDTAVSKAHDHTNLGVLNGLADSGGTLRYLGQPVNRPEWTATDW
jgi:hypothetical protein